MEAREPKLSDRDRRLWRRYERAALSHSRTRLHSRRLEQARRVLGAFIEDRTEDACAIGWSAGKDSTALAHLVAQEAGADASRIEFFSVKDDLDFPGEEEYLRDLSIEWKIRSRLRILRPGFSLVEYLRTHSVEIDSTEDLHGGASRFAKKAFYDVLARYRSESRRNAVLLGLRAEESTARTWNLRRRGKIYHIPGEDRWVCQPLVHWKGIDVFAYLLSREIQPLPLYRCISYHEGDPSHVRKSWWIPGAHTCTGGMAWLRRYYPSLHFRLVSIFPESAAYG